MFGRRRFPVLSVIVVAVLAISVAGEMKSDAGLVSRVLTSMNGAAMQFLRTVEVLTGTSIAEESFVFSNGGIASPVVSTPIVSAPADSFSDAVSPEAPSALTVYPETPEPVAAPLPEHVPQSDVPLLVNVSNPLPENFVPQDLVMMREYCDENVVYIKGSEIQGCRVAVDALMTMLRAAKEAGLDNWQVSAGYRSIAYQQQLMDNKIYEYRQQGLSGSQAQSAAARYVAQPGCSEHHTGLAFDLTVIGKSFSSTQQCLWLHEHCWDYGFILRYTEEKQDLTGIAAEAWHFRYVGQPHAQIIRDNGWCLEEYIASLG